jgi:hypothetical protein
VTIVVETTLTVISAPDSKSGEHEDIGEDHRHDQKPEKIIHSLPLVQLNVDNREHHEGGYN